MSKQDVIDYVMETPHNTNRAVLEGLVDTAVEESQVQADWDQNDETAKDYIKNRVGYYKEEVAATSTSKPGEGTTSTYKDDEVTYRIFTYSEGITGQLLLEKSRENCLVMYFEGKKYLLAFTNSTNPYTCKPITVDNGLKLTPRIYFSSGSSKFDIKIENKTGNTITFKNDDWYIIIKVAVPLPSDFIPVATDETVGGIKADSLSDTPDRDTVNYIVIDRDSNKPFIRREINGNVNNNIIDKNTLSGDITRSKGNTMIFASSNSTIEATLGFTATSYPVIVTYIGYYHDNNYPVFKYLVSTADGKKGNFAWNMRSVTPSPIAWTFEGGGNSTFDIVLKYDNSTNEYIPTQTWDEIKTALTKSDRYEDYALLVDGVYMGIERFYVSRNNNLEVDGLSVLSRNTYNFHDITDNNNNNITTTYTILSIDYEVHATKNKVTSKENTVAFQYNLQIGITRDNTGALACHPKNAVAYVLSNAEPNANITAVSNEGPYSFEGAGADSNATGNMPNILYFSTTANGIYKRLKITQGQNGAADTVVMDKEINLNTKLFFVDFTSGPNHWTSNKTAKEIYDAANQGLRVVNNTYGLILINWHYNEHNDKYNLVFSTSGYTADNLIVAKLSAMLVDNSFKGDWEFQSFDCDGIFNVLNDSDIKTGSILSVQAWNNHKPISWKAVDVLTTTNTAAFTPTADYHPATKKYVDDHTPSKISKLENDSNYITAAHVYDGILISSSTPNSTKKFKITVDDTGALTATGVTEA